MKASLRGATPDSPAASLTAWFELHSRQLPWRETYDPYHVWVSEVMLQQTQVDTVVPYYTRFLERFPTLESLAASREEEVLGLWSGLGYYNRARNFRRAAGEVMTRHGGRIPASYDALIRLPGIGRYMAGAILSIAFNQPYPIVDGNVRRVLARYHEWAEPEVDRLWEEAARMAASGTPRTLNQAMMELGATICRVRSPECGACPWAASCLAFRNGTQEGIPASRKRPRTVRVDLCALIDSNERGLLMRENKGLWEFPLLGRLPEGDFEKAGACRHAITHHRIAVEVFLGRMRPRSGYRRVRFGDVPVTSLTRKIYEVVSSKL